ncbi:MAG: hypothetical protein ACE5HT_14805 [Gemmatimonadales bacterium]
MTVDLKKLARLKIVPRDDVARATGAAADDDEVVLGRKLGARWIVSGGFQ